MGVLIAFQNDPVGTIAVKDGEFVLTGDEHTLQNMIKGLRKTGETPEAFVKRLPTVLHGTTSAIPYSGDAPPKLITKKPAGAE